ncbi:MAG TPA: rod shape-determining protein MreC [Acidimicrobiia bacterium]|nr:rod shape-determining protein MreC [Acidimicrobiia bacterium]
MAGARRASRRRYVLLVIVLTCLTLITLDSRNGRSGPIGTLGGLAHRVVGPIAGAVDDVARPVGDWWSGVFDAGKLKRENRRLEQENAALRGKQTSADEAIRENNDLKAALGLHNALLVKNVTGLIVGRDPGNFDPTLTIDKGSESGIAIDMPVIAPEGIVGKVIDVWKGGAKIQVLTDPQFSVGVQTPGHGLSPATTGIASGQVGSHDLAVQFDAGTAVRRGDHIVTSPQSTLFPSGLPVGTISSVDVQPGNTGVDATITPFVHLGALQYVTVLLWSAGTPGSVLPTTTTTTTTTTTIPAGFGTTTIPSGFGTTTTTGGLGTPTTRGLGG